MTNYFKEAVVVLRENYGRYVSWSRILGDKKQLPFHAFDMQAYREMKIRYKQYEKDLRPAKDEDKKVLIMTGKEHLLTEDTVLVFKIPGKTLEASEEALKHIKSCLGPNNKARILVLSSDVDFEVLKTHD